MHHSITVTELPSSYLLATNSEPVETAMVFVHGFLVDAFDTCVDFQSSIDQAPGGNAPTHACSTPADWFEATADAA